MSDGGPSRPRPGTMLAARLHPHASGPVLRLDEVPIPEPGAGEIVLRVAATGLCHSDLHLLDGSVGVGAPGPVTLGHEIAGWVHAIGPGVDDLAAGEAVAALCVSGCGLCEWCMVGDHELCPRMQIAGSSVDGGFAEFVLVPRRDRLVPLGDLDPVEAAPLTDAALTPYRALLRATEVLRPGAWLVVLGIGGLGEYAVQLARALTGASVIAVDPRATRRQRAFDLGVDVALDAADPDLPARILDCTAGRGAAAVIDLVGSSDTLAVAGQVVGRRGIVLLVGLAGGTFTTSFAALAPEASLTTVLSGGNARHLSEVVDLFRRRRISGSVVRYPLASIADAIDDLGRGRVEGRAVLVPEGGSIAT